MRFVVGGHAYELDLRNQRVWELISPELPKSPELKFKVIEKWNILRNGESIILVGGKLLRVRGPHGAKAKAVPFGPPSGGIVDFAVAPDSEVIYVLYSDGRMVALRTDGTHMRTLTVRAQSMMVLADGSMVCPGRLVRWRPEVSTPEVLVTGLDETCTVSSSGRWVSEAGDSAQRIWTFTDLDGRNPSSRLRTRGSIAAAEWVPDTDLWIACERRSGFLLGSVTLFAYDPDTRERDDILMLWSSPYASISSYPVHAPPIGKRSGEWRDASERFRLLDK